jgi:peptidoglycan/LPS O-acetylase OafA/YrhL
MRYRGAIALVVAALVGFALLFACDPNRSPIQRVAMGVSLNSLAAGGMILVLELNPFGILASLLSRAWLVAVGRYSYFLYLMHMPMLFYTLAAYSGGAVRVRPVIALCITAVGAVASWRFIESPLIQIGKRRHYSSARLDLTRPRAPAASPRRDAAPHGA